MGATYGAAWDRSLGQAPISDVKTMWGDALADFMHNDDAKRAIVWALKNLPDTVPNSRQFRSLCRQAPAKVVPMLAAPVVNPEIAAKVLGGLKATALPKVDHKAWAHRIIARAKSGAKVSPTVLQMAGNALGAA
ncbi:hypothetical protein CHU94_08175 [Rhodoferax sp. TH121]|nr:hypothetical protein CHU94_08175 [Rhodoferax sp. TH121]